MAAPPRIPQPYTAPIVPGTQQESDILFKSQGASLLGSARHADAGQFWVYQFAVSAGARCRLSLQRDEPSGTPTVVPLDVHNLPLPISQERDADGSDAFVWTVPDNWRPTDKMLVRISAKPGPITIKRVLFTQAEPSTSGVPNSVIAQLTEGLPAGTKVAFLANRGAETTLQRANAAPTPSSDLQNDVVILDSLDQATAEAWKARGYTVWFSTDLRDTPAAGQPAAADAQTSRDGAAITRDGRAYVYPSTARATATGQAINSALGAGSDGVLVDGAGVWSKAAYSPAFKEAWTTKQGGTWQDPSTSMATRWQTSQFMANLVQTSMGSLLSGVSDARPAAERIITLDSSFSSTLRDLIEPPRALSFLPSVQGVVGLDATDLMDTPVRHGGVRTTQPFAISYLSDSALVQLMRGTQKPVWLRLTPALTGADTAAWKDRLEECTVSALLLKDADHFDLSMSPQQATPLPEDLQTELDAITAAVRDPHPASLDDGNAAVMQTVGILVGDTAAWQTDDSAGSSADAILALAIPLLQRGIPVQLVPLERATEPSFLRQFKTLLLSYDMQKPLESRIHEGLADWTRRGGSLVVFGGTDAFNTAPGTWWTQAGLPAPQTDLWKVLGVPATGGPTTVPARTLDLSRMHPLQATSEASSIGRSYSFDISESVKSTGSVLVRLGNDLPATAAGQAVVSVELRIAGQLALAFRTGSEMENRFLVNDLGSTFNGYARVAPSGTSWFYQFDNLPSNAQAILTINGDAGITVSATDTTPDVEHSMIATKDSGDLRRQYPRVRVMQAFPITLYALNTPGEAAPDSTGKQPHGPREARPGLDELSVLYALRSGGAPIWLKQVDQGLVLNAGIAPGYFAASERGAGFLRAIAQYAQQRAGGQYRETGFLRIKRGHVIAVKTFAEPCSIPGRTIDVFSPKLDVVADRQIPPRSRALLVDIGAADQPPHVGFVTGRLEATVETPVETAFFVRGSAGRMCEARLHAGTHAMSGAVALDRSGHRLPLDTAVEGDTVLLRFPHDPDGVVVRVGWK
jgi:hypothetical protein